MTKVVVRIIGGLGNQLFSYAAARRLAIAGGAELVVDDISGFANDHRYQRTYQLQEFQIPCRLASATERMEPFARVRRYVRRRLSRNHPFEQRSYIQQEGVDFDTRLLATRPSGTVWIEGYWQSEGYFADVADVIRTDLRIRPPADTANLKAAEEIARGQAVAVHVRFFDPPSSPGVDNVSGDYYARAIARMEQLQPGSRYFVFSDQPAAARARIPLPDDRITLISHNRGDEAAYADLWLMTQCQHFVIANSSFSWWGAWLAGHQGKRIIAPGFESREGTTWWGFKGLLPDAWIKL